MESFLMDLNTENIFVMNKREISSELPEKEEILHDYFVAFLSRQLSLAGRKEVLSGKGKFGIFGDGKEIAQIAMAKNFKDGDWRSGYYRDQTFMLYLNLLTPVEFFSQIYGDTDLKNNPSTAGRNFNNHYSTPNYAQGEMLNLMAHKNSSADISPTAGQMPRLLGLAYASKLFRQLKIADNYKNLTHNGNEVAFGMIGDASTSEGHFFETLNAAGVLQVPMALAVWDDGYGISVPKSVQTTKQSISELLKGFEADNSSGIKILKAKGWDYTGLCKTFNEGIQFCRIHHVPVLFHIEEMTQPFGHSTSGSHERYKTKERLEWEAIHDPLKNMREWILNNQLAETSELENLERKATELTQESRKKAWKLFTAPIIDKKNELLKIISSRVCECQNSNNELINKYYSELDQIQFPIYKDVLSIARKLVRHVCLGCNSEYDLKQQLVAFIHNFETASHEKYSTHLYNQTQHSALCVEEIKTEYSENSKWINGREIIRNNFAKLFEKYPLLVAFGEDIGKIGGVNLTYEGLQEQFGNLRISDTGIRETTIIGQGIGLALRGFRPIAEIQYFDYLLYGLQTLSDDLATTHWRTKGQQVAPLIISTRGHRLEGVWHSGSPLGVVINALRGIYVCVPRNMTQAAGMYNTLLKAHDPAIVIEPLNAYRLKEQEPDNIGEYTVPLGIPEILCEGKDVTLVTYGSCVRIAQDAVEQLKQFDIQVELIDVQTLLPFDINHTILNSIKKTNRIVFLDEDVPGGASAYMMQKVLEEQNGYYWLDAQPRTISGNEHRPAYSSDGDYISNPNAENVFDEIYQLMQQDNPLKWEKIY